MNGDSSNRRQPEQKSLKIAREALEAGFSVYPLSDWYKKHSPPVGMTGSWHLDGVSKPEHYSSQDAWERFVRACTAEYREHNRSKQVDVEGAVRRWSQLVWHTEFSFCGYPPEGFTALDVDNMSVLDRVCDVVGIDSKLFISLLQTSYAVVNEPVRHLKGHSFIRLPDETDMPNRQAKELLHRFMTELKFPVWCNKANGYVDKGLGDRIIRPYLKVQQGGGKYQKLHGGWCDRDGNIDTAKFYRFTDKNGRTVPFSAIHDTPKSPLWLFEAISRHFNGSCEVNTTGTKVFDRQVLKPQSIQHDNNEDALDKLHRLFLAEHPVDTHLKLLEKHLPEGCHMTTHAGEPRVEATGQSGEPGGQWNPKDDGSSFLYIHSTTLATAMQVPVNTELNLTAMVLLDQQDWHKQRSMVGQMIGKLESRLPASKSQTHCLSSRHNTREIDSVSSLMAHLSERRATMPANKLNDLLVDGQVQYIVERYGLKLETGRDRAQHAQHNSRAISKAATLWLAEHDTFMLNTSPRMEGQLWDHDPEEAIGAITQSPMLSRFILKNHELVQTDGWQTFVKNQSKQKTDKVAALSDLKAYGWFDALTGEGDTNMAFVDRETQDVYVYHKQKMVKRLACEDTSVVSFTSDNYKHFTKLDAADFTGIEETKRKAAKLIGLCTLHAEGWQTLHFQEDRQSRTGTYVSDGRDPMPDPDGKAAVLLGFLSEALTGRSTSWFHINGIDDAAKGKSKLIWAVKELMAGSIQSKLDQLFTGKVYDKQPLIGKRFLIDDEASEISAGSMTKELKALITDGVQACRMHSRVMHHTKPMSILSAGNLPLHFPDADGIADSIERRLIHMTHHDDIQLKGKDTNFQDNVKDDEWDAFVSILVQPELFGLGDVCYAIQQSAKGYTTDHTGLEAMKTQARADDVISQPIKPWIADAIVADANGEIDRDVVFTLAQQHKVIDMTAEKTRGKGRQFMLHLTNHIRSIGGSEKIKRRTKNGSTFVHTGVRCEFELNVMPTFPHKRPF